jgi:site-specific DNA-methyltransferase (adenine-specific)
MDIKGDGYEVLFGSCLDRLPELPDNSVDAIVSDPPYELGFMGKSWDNSGIAYNVEVWRECLRVLKPGGHMLAFGGTRTWHRIAVAIEDAGFEVRDSIAWLYSSGFPKSMNIGKAIDKAAGAKRKVIGTKIVPDQRGGKINSQATAENGVVSYEINVTAPATDDAIKWDGWGTALKPAFEPIIVARKPLAEKTVAANVLKWGTGAINIDGTRIGSEERTTTGMSSLGVMHDDAWVPKDIEVTVSGRWPANILLDEHTAELLDEQADASRFFYVSKANKRDRNEGDVANTHPTVKPTDLMRYLIKLVTQPGGVVLDPFTGSGSTGKAAILEGNKFIGVELTEEYFTIIQGRLEHAKKTKLTITNEGLF